MSTADAAAGVRRVPRGTLARVRVVLYEPQDPINIAATVRAMKNMGARDLVLVRPVEYEANRIEQVAHDTRDIVSRIVHVERLDDALADCSLTVAFAGKRRAARWRTSTPRDVAPEVLAAVSTGNAALLFGREDHGLPNEALDRASVVVHIPSTEHASLNLAQAVMLALYELHMASGLETRELAPSRKAAPTATDEQREQLFHDAQATLDSMDFFKTRNPELVVRTVRSLVMRAGADAREVSLLRAMALEVRHSLERARTAALGAERVRGGMGTGSAEDLRWRGRAETVVQGGASTGSKRSATLYGDEHEQGPTHFRSARGCRVVTAGGSELVDLSMALGAVAIGYADPAVSRAVAAAAQSGNVSGLSSMLEVEVAELLYAAVPNAERVRFMKSGAEGVAAAVRIARAATGRTKVIGSGYFGWQDWSSSALGVPDGVKADFTAVRFDNEAELDHAVAAAGEELAAIVIEPVVEHAPSESWLAAARAHCDRIGAVLVFDEIKTGFRISPCGWQGHSAVRPDVTVYGKALANGYPLAAVVGSAAVMEAADHTWISTTLASESTALVAAREVLYRHQREDVCSELSRIGGRLRKAVSLALDERVVAGVRIEGLDAMWFLSFDSPNEERLFLRAARGEGVLFKRGPYVFASLAHDPGAIAAVTRAARAGVAAILAGREGVNA